MDMLPGLILFRGKYLTVYLIGKFALLFNIYVVYADPQLSDTLAYNHEMPMADQWTNGPMREYGVI